MEVRSTTWLTIILTLTCVACCVDGKCEKSFVISRDPLPDSAATSRGFLKRQPLNSFNECLRLCANNHKCDSVRFDSDAVLHSKSAECILFGASGATNSKSDKSSANAVYFAHKVCLSKHTTGGSPVVPSSSCTSSWQYERHSGIALRPAMQTFVLRTIFVANSSECLDKCTMYEGREERNEIPRSGSNTNLHTCRAVGFDEDSRKCQLYAIAPNSVREVGQYFMKNLPNTTAVFERACTDEIGLSARKCDFLPTRGSAMIALFDDRIADVTSDSDCHKMCIEWRRGPICRSYTYDSLARECFISHASSGTAQSLSNGGRRVTITEGGMFLADLDDCIDSPSTPTNCQYDIEDSFTFQTRLEYSRCGTKKDKDSTASYFSNTLFLKDGGTELVTIRDKMVTAMCKITLTEDLSVKYSFNVEGNGTAPERRTLLLAEGLQAALEPKFSLDVLDTFELPTNDLTEGDTAFVVISVQQSNDANGITSFHVSDMVAEDADGNLIARLYDEDGCPINAQLGEPLERLVDGTVRGKIHMKEMNVTADSVTFRALVQPCAGRCPKPCERSANHLYRRRRRSVIQPTLLDPHGRSFHLSEENYVVSTDVGIRSVRSTAVRGIRRLQDIELQPTGVAQIKEFMVPRRDTNQIRRLTQSLVEGEEEDDGSPFVRLRHPTTLQLCLSTQKFSCIFTGLLIVMQMILISLCILVVYMYWQYVKNYSQRLMRTATNWRCPPVEVFEPRTPPPKYSEVVGEGNKGEEGRRENSGEEGRRENGGEEGRRENA